MALTNKKLDALIVIHEKLALTDGGEEEAFRIIFADTAAALKELKRLRDAKVSIPVLGRVS
jgi:hypothetical protein